jgi:ubiquinone/menaquinone biosynthesis C-methylase UbiE
MAKWFGARVLAVEPATAMRSVSMTESPSTVVHIAGRAEAIPLRTSSIGVAWLSTVIHHFEDLPASVSELRRVLIPGGVVLIRGLFAESPLFPLFAYFPGIERSVASFPRIGEIIEAFIVGGFTHETRLTVTEQHGMTLHEWYEHVRDFHQGDSMLRPLSNEEFSAGLTVIQNTNARGGARRTYRAVAGISARTSGPPAPLGWSCRAR